jgi:hypothetical protein
VVLYVGRGAGIVIEKYAFLISFLPDMNRSAVVVHPEMNLAMAFRYVLNEIHKMKITENINLKFCVLKKKARN